MQLSGVYRNDNFNLFAYPLQGRIPGWPVDDDGFTASAHLRARGEVGAESLALELDHALLTEIVSDPATRPRDRLDLVNATLEHGRTQRLSFVNLQASYRVGVVMSGDFGGAAMQNYVHAHVGGRLLQPDPTASEGRNEQLQDRYLQPRRAGLTLGGNLSVDSNVFDDLVEARASLSATLALGATGVSSLSARTSLVIDPLRHTGAWLRPRAELGAEWTRYTTNNPALLRPGWYQQGELRFSPRLSVDLLFAPAGVTWLQLGAEVQRSPAGEPIVGSTATLAF